MKKVISLCIIIFLILITLCGCTVYKYNPMPSEYEAKYIIGHTPDEIIDRYGEPYFIERFDEVADETGNISAIAYRTGEIDQGFGGYSEYLHIEFDRDTGLANSMIHPWVDNESVY